MSFSFMAVLVIVFSFYFKAFHLLSFLIGMEMLGLCVLITLFLSLYFFFSGFFIILFFLSLMACESAVGLVLFVFFTRVYSKDYVYYLGVVMF